MIVPKPLNVVPDPLLPALPVLLYPGLPHASILLGAKNWIWNDDIRSSFPRKLKENEGKGPKFHDVGVAGSWPMPVVQLNKEVEKMKGNGTLPLPSPPPPHIL